MKTLLFALFLLALSTSLGHAGQPVITETETGITVEYTGDPEIVPGTTNGTEAPSASKPANAQTSEALNSIPQESNKTASEEKEARRAQIEERRAARAARRSSREPRGSEED